MNNQHFTPAEEQHYAELVRLGVPTEQAFRLVRLCAPSGTSFATAPAVALPAGVSAPAVAPPAGAPETGAAYGERFALASSPEIRKALWMLGSSPEQFASHDALSRDFAPEPTSVRIARGEKVQAASAAAAVGAAAQAADQVPAVASRFASPLGRVLQALRPDGSLPAICPTGV